MFLYSPKCINTSLQGHITDYPSLLRNRIIVSIVLAVTCGATGVVCCELLATDGVALDATDIAGAASSLTAGVDVTALSCFELLIFVASVIHDIICN